MYFIFKILKHVSDQKNRLDSRLRRLYYRGIFGSCGRKLRVGRDVIITGPHCIHAGSNFKIKDKVIIRALGGLTVGNNVTISSLASILTTELMIEDGKLLDKHTGSPIKLGNNVWICAGAVVLAGVSIGDNTIIAAGAVVTKDCVGGWIYAGIPAKPVKKLNY